MYLLKPLNEKCRQFFQWELPAELRKDEGILVGFPHFHEIVDTLAAADLKPDRDFLIE